MAFVVFSTTTGRSSHWKRYLRCICWKWGYQPQDSALPQAACLRFLPFISWNWGTDHHFWSTSRSTPFSSVLMTLRDVFSEIVLGVAHFSIICSLNLYGDSPQDPAQCSGVMTQAAKVSRFTAIPGSGIVHEELWQGLFAYQSLCIAFLTRCCQSPLPHSTWSVFESV